MNSVAAYLNRNAKTGLNLFRVDSWGVDVEHRSTVVHKHSHFEVCYVVEGQGTYTDNGREYTLRPGMLFMSKPGALHQIVNKPKTTLFHICFYVVEGNAAVKLSQAAEALVNTSKVVLYEQHQSAAARIWDAILVQAHEEQRAHLVLTYLVDSLLLSFCQAFDEERLDRTDATQMVHLRDTSVVSRACDYVANNLGSSLRLSEIATDLHISRRHLSRLFLSQLGCTYSEYVQRERLRLATARLLKTDAPIRSIASLAGFSSIHHFSRVFKAFSGVSPRRFRELVSLKPF